jgi:hypothetical protein
MTSNTQHRASLLILLAASERALEAFQAAENPVDEEFVIDLERIIARTRAELEAIARAMDAAGTSQDSA